MERAAPESGTAARPGTAALLRRTLQLLAPHRGACVVVVVAMLVQLAFALGYPLCLQLVFDRAIAEKDSVLLAKILGALAGGLLLASGAGVLQDRLTARIGSDVLHRLREDLFERLLGMGTDWYRRVDSGDLLSRFSGDLGSVETFLAQGLRLGIYSVILALTSVALLFTVDWRLALAVLVVAPVVTTGPNLLGPRASEASLRRKEDEGRALSLVQETVAGHATIQAFGLEGRLRGSFDGHSRVLLVSSTRFNLLSALVGRTTNLSVTVLVLFVLGAGAWLAIRGHLSTGALLSFVGLLLNLDESSNGLATAMPHALKAVGSLARVDEVLAATPPVREAEDAIALPRLRESLRFERVDFSYGSAGLQLADVTLEVRRGQFVAFVGGSGSGKSTALQLIMRTRDPGAGAVLLDGIDLRSGTLASLRSQTSVVLQDPFLFNDTIRENVRQGRPDASDEEIEAAAQAAGCRNFIRTLPEGWQTRAGERGAALSGGQRQRVAIARALLRRPALLLLDEATAALDPASEESVCRSLEQLPKDVTVVTVTHSLAPVQRADRLFVFDAGRIAEQGTHEELLARGGLYRALWDKQSGFRRDERGFTVEPARLRAIPLLAGVEEPSLVALARRFGTEHHEPGDVIIHQGRPGRAFHILARGSVEVLAETPGAPPRRVAVMQTGDHFGEMALLEDVPTRATVRALTPATTLVLDAAQFQALMGELPQLRQAMAAEMERRLGLRASGSEVAVGA